MTEYRISYWEGGDQYTTIIGSTSYEALRQMLKQQYDRFTMEEVC